MGSISENFVAFSDVPQGKPDGMNDLRLRLVADKSPNKIDLGAGVYRDTKGKYYELPVIRKVCRWSEKPDYGRKARYQRDCETEQGIDETRPIGKGDSCSTAG